MENKTNGQILDWVKKTYSDVVLDQYVVAIDNQKPVDYKLIVKDQDIAIRSSITTSNASGFLLVRGEYQSGKKINKFNTYVPFKDTREGIINSIATIVELSGYKPVMVVKE